MYGSLHVGTVCSREKRRNRIILFLAAGSVLFFVGENNEDDGGRGFLADFGNGALFFPGVCLWNSSDILFFGWFNRNSGLIYKKKSAKQTNGFCTVFILLGIDYADWGYFVKKDKKYCDGYLTVEASFIVPILFGIMLFLISWGFYCYDKSVSVQCSYLASLRASNQWEIRNGEKEALAMEELEKLTAQTMLYIKPEKTYAKAGLLEIRTGITGGFSIGGTEKKGSRKWMIQSEEKAYLLNPTSFIRRYRIFGEG